MFASMHIMNVTGDYVKNVIKQNSAISSNNFTNNKSKLIAEALNVLGEDFLKTHYYGIETGRAYSLFSDKFGLESINDDACEYFNFTDSPIILTFGLFEEDALLLSIIKDGKIMSEIMLAAEDNGYDFVTHWKNCKCFEWFFGITEQQLREITDMNDLFSTGERMANLFKLPLNISYDDIEENIEEFNADEFSI